jgi:hypothetical protein
MFLIQNQSLEFLIRTAETSGGYFERNQNESLVNKSKLNAGKKATVFLPDKAY